jgi:hypothetical protein
MPQNVGSKEVTQLMIYGDVTTNPDPWRYPGEVHPHQRIYVLFFLSLNAQSICPFLDRDLVHMGTNDLVFKIN